MNLAFILQSEAKLPEPADILKSLAQSVPELRTGSVETEGSGFSIELPGFGFVVINLMDTAIPGQEAELNGRNSFARYFSQEELPESHAAHLVIALNSTELDVEPPPAHSRGDGSVPRGFYCLRVLGALCLAAIEHSPATGVYWAEAQSTHPIGFFREVMEQSSDFPLLLWLGMSMIRLSAETVSQEEPPRPPIALHSFGMSQFSLPELMIRSTEERLDDAVGIFLEAVDSNISQEAAPEAGETYQFLDNESSVVTRESSPLHDKLSIWSFDLK